MPLWLARILTVVLYVAVMAALAWVLKATVPNFNKWMEGLLGKEAWFDIVVALASVGGIYAFWPRDPEGRMKPLLSRRR